MTRTPAFYRRRRVAPIRSFDELARELQLAAQLARVNFASYLGSTGPPRLDSGVPQQLIARREKLLCRFAWGEHEPKSAHAPILIISL